MEETWNYDNSQDLLSNIDLREVRFIAPRLYRMCYTGTIVHMESLFASIKTYNLAGAFLIVDLSVISFITNS